MKDAQSFLAWCLAMNYLTLIVWFGVFTFAHDVIYKLHSRWFKLSLETFDTVQYIGMSVYKIEIMLFNLVPLIAHHFAYR